MARPRSPKVGSPPTERLRNAYYIKLGAGGKYALDSIKNGRLRFGWDVIPLTEILEKDWPSIRRRLAKEHTNKATITADTERLRDIVTSTSADVWITFHDSHLWWGRLSAEPVRQDAVSKFRTLIGGWRKADTKGEPLTINRIPGVIAQLQGFRGTVCSVGNAEALVRLINGEVSPEHRKLEASHRQVIEDVQTAIRGLHWKDFEVLVDLVFRQAGWRRRSMLGESMKYVDLELVEPITGEVYQVQVKSKSSKAEFQTYARQFTPGEFRRLYYVVHSPSPDLVVAAVKFDGVELVLPPRLGELVVEGGLVGWVLDKVR